MSFHVLPQTRLWLEVWNLDFTFDSRHVLQVLWFECDRCSFGSLYVLHILLNYVLQKRSIFCKAHCTSSQSITVETFTSWSSQGTKVKLTVLNIQRHFRHGLESMSSPAVQRSVPHPAVYGTAAANSDATLSALRSLHPITSTSTRPTTSSISHFTGMPYPPLLLVAVPLLLVSLSRRRSAVCRLVAAATNTITSTTIFLLKSCGRLLGMLLYLQVVVWVAPFYLARAVWRYPSLAARSLAVGVGVLFAFEAVTFWGESLTAAGIDV